MRRPPRLSPSAGASERGPGAAVGKLLGRDRATLGGVGYATTALASGETVAAIAVANAFGDVIAQDGALLGAPHGDSGELLRSAELIAQMPEPPYPSMRSAQQHYAGVRLDRRRRWISAGARSSRASPAPGSLVR